MTLYTDWHLEPVHRNGDARVCGASTVVSGQTTVFANNVLVSVNGDPNSHSAGNLVADTNHVYANNIMVVNNTPDSAGADGLCIPVGPPHCTPSTAGGSPNVYVGDPFAGNPIFVDDPVSYPTNIQPALNDSVPEIAKAEQVDSADESPYDVALSSGPGSGWDEVEGSGKNPRITSIWLEIGYPESFSDETAWCAGYAGAILKRSGCAYLKTASSRAYGTYGEEVLNLQDIENSWNTKRELIKKGDILVFYRQGKSSAYGHVGFSNGSTTRSTVQCLGGNQSDSLNIKSFPIGPQQRSSGAFGLIAVRRAVKCDGSGEVAPDAGAPTEDASGSGGSVT